MKKPRLLLLSTNADRAGAPRHLCELVAGIRERYDLRLGVGAKGYLTECMNDLGVPVTVIPEMVRPVRPTRDLSAYRALRKTMIEFQPHLLHAHSSKAGVLGRLAAHRLGIPSIFTAHGWPFAPGIPTPQRLYSLPVERFMARCTGAIITVSDYDRRLALEKRVAGSGKLFTIHNGISDTPCRADPGSGDDVRLAMVARFTRQKDHDCLIRAMKEVDDNVRCTLAGDGPLLEQARKTVADEGLTGRVEIPGEVTKVARLLADCQLFVLSSRWEGLPISVLEAMRAELPVVASDVGGVSEAVVDGETGLLVTPGNASALAVKINGLVEQPTLRVKLGKAGKCRYEKYFAANEMIDRTIEVYAQVLRGL
ncbi:MAG: glycosyltransferase family 4 protein [Pseudomonadota bacterium]|nr:glycosyltransferase family 4 protein [Pseudomonadota bacterium]